MKQLKTTGIPLPWLTFMTFVIILQW
jgi:hypothetical protein